MKSASPDLGTHTPGKEISKTRLTASQMKTLAISTLGGGLEYYEFLVFAFMVPTLGKVFFAQATEPWIVQLQTLAIFSAGYLARPLGGIVLASLGDRFGRKRMFIVTLALMAGSTLLIGLLPSYAQIGVAAPIALLLCRICQGLALGGELPTACTFVVEHVSEKRSGFALGVLGSGLAVGSLIGIATVVYISKAFSADDIVSYAWRIPFILGGVFGILSALLRRFVSETPVFEEMGDRKTKGKAMPIRELFSKYRPELLIATLASLSSVSIVQAASLFPVTFFQSVLQFPAGPVQAALGVSLVVSTITVVIGGWMMDRFGWMVSMTVTALALIASLVNIYYSPTVDNLMPNMALMGIPGAITIMLNNYFVRVFPAQIRITGIAAAHNVGTAVAGGTLPVLMGYLVHINPQAMVYVPSFFAIVAIVITPFAIRYKKPLRFVRSSN